VKKIAIIGSRRMSPYGKEVIGLLMKELKNKCEVVTIEVSGCNREVMKLGAEKIFIGENFEKLNEQLAEYADILVVIEGDQKSGTILAAKNFLDLGKEVWAVPGRITDENSQMTNYLIRNGAVPLTTVGDLTASLQ
jgi:predicted Rossmann fold nucleotide-binding protein DprA/Smf involved in DNA uptake